MIRTRWILKTTQPSLDNTQFEMLLKQDVLGRVKGFIRAFRGKGNWRELPAKCLGYVLVRTLYMLTLIQSIKICAIRLEAAEVADR